MANTQTGRVLLIGDTQHIEYQGKTFQKRELVLDASRYDQFTGEKYENYPKFEFTGRHADDLDAYQVGQLVTVSFILSGRKAERDGKTAYFTNVTAYRIEPYSHGAQPSQASRPSPVTPGTPITPNGPTLPQEPSPAPQPVQDDLPF